MPPHRAEELATWCTKVALLRTHRDRKGEQESHLDLTHRFYKERSPLANMTVQVGRVVDSEGAFAGNISRQLRTLGALDLAPADMKIDSVNLVTFQIGQLFFQVVLSTGAEWSEREAKRLLAAGRRNRARRVHILQPNEEVPLTGGITQEQFFEIVGTCRMVSQVSSLRDNNMIRELMRARRNSS